MTDAPDPGTDPDDGTGKSNTGEPGSDLSDAVEDALRPATHDAVMAVWQRVVLGRLDREQPVTEDDELLRRLYEGERPDDPPS